MCDIIRPMVAKKIRLRRGARAPPRSSEDPGTARPPPLGHGAWRGIVARLPPAPRTPHPAPCCSKLLLAYRVGRRGGGRGAARRGAGRHPAASPVCGSGAGPGPTCVAREACRPRGAPQAAAGADITGGVPKWPAHLRCVRAWWRARAPPAAPNPTRPFDPTQPARQTARAPARAPRRAWGALGAAPTRGRGVATENQVLSHQMSD